MLGNDIVDLKLASVQSNWRRKGFLNKIFTKTEQDYIFTSLEPDLLVWQLWTLKEAAYKIYSRQTNTRTFEPTGIVCELGEESKPIQRVFIKKECYFTKTQITRNYIYSIAAVTLKDLEQSKSAIYRGNAKNFNYHALASKSISHHGDYLALVDF